MKKNETVIYWRKISEEHVNKKKENVRKRVNHKWIKTLHDRLESLPKTAS